MIGEPSCSTTPDPTQLAPGFRFHPTDEELVGYYLKRKVTGRPIRADAIAEVDVYGTEPWDLPTQSRLRTRDLEWYFFTSLGRKYSNRCRTNRATVEGYWKTTGKDRSVHGGSRVIGMKKTLVFHIGRAPSGRRTNWVMHEYRLEDENLARCGVQQDVYVVCKIFEKIGAGPQNGAQYGAPFIEEEWDRDEDEEANAVPVKEGRDNAHMDPSVRGFVQLGDFLLDQDSDIPRVDTVSHPARSNDEDHDSEAEDPSNFLIESLAEQGSDNDMPRDTDIPTMQESITSLSRFGKQKVLENQSNSASIQNNGFVQLKDIFDEENTSSILNVESADCFMERCNNNSHMEQVGNSEILLQDATFINQSGQLCMCHDIRHDYCLEMYSLDNMPSQRSSGQLAGVNLMNYDAVSHEVPSLENGLKNDTSLASMADFSYLDELMAYYDATDDNINSPPTDYFLPLHESSASSMVGASSSSSKEGHVRQNLEAYESLQRAPPSNYDPLSGGNGNLIADPKLKDQDNNTLTKRLATLLNAITAPPAFAGEASVMGKFVEKTSSSSTDTVRITAGMIQLQSLMPLMADTESWKLQKQTDMNLLLSYGISKSVCSERKKFHGGFSSTVCWLGFHLFFIGSFVLALSYKLGVRVCNL